MEVSMPHHQGAVEPEISIRGCSKDFPGARLSFRSAVENDQEFLFSVYESTRADEMAVTGWSPEAISEFLRMQFRLQDTQYRLHYENASFEVVIVDGVPAGRLYLDRRKDDIRVMDIALLPAFRRMGAGAAIFSRLIDEADRKGLQLSLHVEQNNPVLPWYERLGFRKIDVNGIYFFMKREPAAKNNGITTKEEEIMIGKLSLHSFHPHLKDRFEVRTKSGEKVDLELVEIKDTSTGMVQGFHLIFRGPADKVFGHDTHRVSHAKIGEFDLFLGPVMYGKTDGVYYQAVFSRLKAGAKKGLAAKKTGKAAVKKAAKKAVKKGAKKIAKKTGKKKR
jgi:ribosomal protein S18 acetylase RimI-like enzyme